MLTWLAARTFGVTAVAVALVACHQGHGEAHSSPSESRIEQRPLTEVGIAVPIASGKPKPGVPR
jgi:hypothetical protein